MSTALVLSRPVRVTHEGGFVEVGVHDATFYREMTQWATDILEAHRRGAGYLRRKVLRLSQWLLREWRWYQELRMLPPDASVFGRWVVHTYGMLEKSIPIPMREPRTGMLLPRRPGTCGRRRVMVVDYAR